MRPRPLAFVVSAALVVLSLIGAASASAAFVPISSFGSSGAGAGQLAEPGNGHFAPDGNLYVADWGNNRVSVFSPAGKFLFAFGKEVNVADSSDRCDATSGCKAGAATAAAGAIHNPEDLTFLAGKVYVADTANKRIDVFSEEGKFEFAFGLGVSTTAPTYLCTTTCRAGQKGATAGELQELQQPTGIVAVESFLVVVDRLNNRVEAFQANGQAFGVFGKKVRVAGGPEADVCNLSTPGGCQTGEASSEAGGFKFPTGVTYSNEQLLISDSGNGRVDVYSVATGFTRAFGRDVGPAGADTCTAATGCTAGVEEGAGGIGNAAGLTTDAAGNLYVTEPENSRVSEFNPAGNFVRAFGEGVATGAASFQVCTLTCLAGIQSTSVNSTPEPFGVAVDPSGRILVIQGGGKTEAARVTVFGDVPDPVVNPPAPPAPPKPPTVVRPSNRVKLGNLKLNPKEGTATLSITVPDPGKLVLSGKGLKKATRSAKLAGVLKLPVKLVGKGRKDLLADGRAKVKATIAFSPTGGTTRTTTKSLSLRLELP